MKHLFTLFFLLAATFVAAQTTVRTDTIATGYYVPFDSNMVSCKVIFMFGGKITQQQNTTGNELPPELVESITHLYEGAIVVYDEITVLENGMLKKTSPVRYFIGTKNTRSAVRDPHSPLISKEDLTRLELDTNTVSFTVSFTIDHKSQDYPGTGNKIPEAAKASIRQLKPGNKVFIERRIVRNEKGEEVKMPSIIYTVIE